MANHIVDLGIFHNENCFVSDIFKVLYARNKQNHEKCYQVDQIAQINNLLEGSCKTQT